MKISLASLRNMKVHFIGIGGAGMSGIARIMLDQGICVSGSDAKDSPTVQSLRIMGAEVYVGHSGEHVDEVDVVVVSSAISQGNPELVAAQKQGKVILPRAEALAILMSESIAIAVAGTHGKTTTTSMLTVALQHAGLDPSFAIGGTINSSGTNAHLGTGEIFVAEADESDGSFLAYSPTCAIITNIELDHVDHFPDLDSLMKIFAAFVANIKSGGFLIACHDDEGVTQLLQGITRSDISILTYGTAGELTYSRLFLSPGGSAARITHNGKVLGELQLQVPGEHNMLKALAALSAGVCLTTHSAPDLIKGLSSFTGARRRFELKGSPGGVRVIDDYGHHPTEIEVTLTAARRYAEGGRLLVIFQPHRYSRTQAFAADFAKALSLADQVFLLEIYPASEDPIPGVDSTLISKEMDPSKVTVEPSMITIVEDVVTAAKPGDVILTLGAGDVSSLASVIVQTLPQ